MFGKFFILISVCLIIVQANRNERIVGGQPAQLGQVPFQASLRAHGTTFHFAGGIIISNRWILTVAHKVSGRAANSITIMLGIVLLNGSGTSRRSDTITIHPNFDFVTMANDIACVRTGTSISFSQTIQSIFISSSIIEGGFHAQISGWGATSDDKGPNADVLQTLTVITKDNSECEEFHGVRVTDAHICATGFFSGTGMCTTDVGGPLVFSSQLIGMASWHDIPCGQSPDMYIRISAFRDWIRSVTGA